MPTRSEQDFILRQIRLVAEAIARALGMRRSGTREEARGELDAAWREVLGPLAPVVLRADPTTAAALVGDPRRLILLAQLRAEHGDLSREEDGDAAHATAAWHDAWALGVTLEALDRDPGTPDGVEMLARLGPRVADRDLSERGRGIRARLAALGVTRPA